MFALRQNRRSRVAKSYRRRIALEQLENRLVLATVIVTTAEDSYDIPLGGTIADLPGPDGVVSLREAVVATDTTAGADEVVFDTAGAFATPQTIVLELGELRITDDVAINGPGADDVVVDAQENSRVFNVDDAISSPSLIVSITGLTIRGGVANYGGGILNRETLTITDSSISGNSAGANGGGIRSLSGSLTITDSTISDNSAASRGGGIFSEPSGSLTITDSTISGNSAGTVGGGIVSDLSGSLTITNSTISDNSAGTAGGGIFSEPSGSLTITDSTISGNSAASRGGGIFSELSGSLTITNSTISGNSAERDGGGIFSERGSLTITNSTISDNSAERDGGGIYSYLSGSLTITDSTISGNSAESDGGGIFSDLSGSLTITNSTISDNSAGTSGGGIFSEPSGSLTITDSTISGNSAGTSGGGIVSSSSSLTITGSTISGNSAGGNGGGIWVDTDLTGGAPIANSTISGNIALGSGGGIFNRDGRTVVEYSTITNNYAPPEQGSGIANLYDITSRTEVASSIVAGNVNSDVDLLSGFGISSFISNGYNLMGTGNIVAAFNNNDIIDVTDPGLAPLANYGGPTQTHALLPGSQAVDAGDPSAMAGVGDVPEFDQRGEGFGRVVDGDGDGVARIDIGAFENQQTPCGDPFMPSGTIGDDHADFYYTSATGALVMDTDARFVASMIIDGPQAQLIEFLPLGWENMYFNNSEQWFDSTFQGLAGIFRLATYDAGLFPSLAFTCVEYGSSDNSTGIPADTRFADVTIDDQPPTATATAPGVTQPRGTTQLITVEYTDNVAVASGVFDDNDIIVTGPNSFVAAGEFVSSTPTPDGRGATVTYEIAAPAGGWGIDDNGTYTIETVAGEVTDLGGNGISSEVVGSFTVDIRVEIVSITIPEGMVEGTADAFVAFATTPSGSAGLTYLWEFGDGDSKNGSVVSKGFADDGTYSVTITASDTMGNSDSITDSVMVANLPPIAIDDPVSMLASDSSVSVNVLDNDTDPGPLDVLTVTELNGSAVMSINGLFGTLTWDEIGEFEYVLDLTDPAVQNLPMGYQLADAFEYTVTDGDGGFDTAVFSVEINGVAPVPEPVELFHDTEQVLGSGNNHDVDLADLDGDDDLDAFITTDFGQPDTVWFNNGLGVFTNSSQTLGAFNSIYAALGDIDNDDDIDAVVVGGGRVVVWLNNGDGVFELGQEIVASDTLDVALGNLDDDDFLDAFVARAGTGTPNLVFLNDGFGQLVDSGQALGSSVSKSVEFGDLDGDDDLDAFVGNGRPGGEPNKVWLNDGFGVFTDSGQNLGSSQTQHAALGDLDDDGDLDAFSANSSGGTDRVWFNTGNAIFVDTGQTLGNGSGSHVAVADLDQDGDLDAFTANWLDQPNDVWLNVGGGAFANSGQLIGAQTSSHVALGDIDDDGDTDAVIANFFGQPNQVYFNVTVNRPPMPQPDFFNGNEDLVLDIALQDVLANDMDPEWDDLTVVATDAVSEMGAEVTLTTVITYDPTMAPLIQALPLGAFGTDTFEYTVDDGNGNTASTTVTIEVEGENDTPEAEDDMLDADCGDAAANVTSTLLSNDTDIDLGDVLFVASIDDSATQGQVILVGDQVFYTPPDCGDMEPGQSFSDTFTYEVSDGLATDSATMFVMVTVPFDPRDFNMDGVVDGDDIDLICLCLAFDCQEPQFDLDGNGVVGAPDYALMLESMGTKLGDANLDGAVDVRDFNVWNNNKFQANDPALSGVGWATADFNCDGSTDVSDFNIWNNNKFTFALLSKFEQGEAYPRRADCIAADDFTPSTDDPLSADSIAVPHDNYPVNIINRRIAVERSRMLFRGDCDDAWNSVDEFFSALGNKLSVFAESHPRTRA